MIAANKNLLKANLTQGVLSIQTNLISLYSSNLTAIATQAALIAGFAFTAVISSQSTTGLEAYSLGYFFYVFFTICFISAITVLSQATLTVTLGPSMALKGNTNDSVKIAAQHMFRQFLFIYRIAIVSITSLFIGACILCWSIYPVGIATIVTVCYIFGYYFLVTEGKKVYIIFGDAMIDSFEDVTDGSYHRLKNKSSDTSGDGTSAGVGAGVQTIDGPVAELIEATKLKARGLIWKRQAIEEGGLFFKCYAVLEKGKLDFFKSSKDFKEGGNPLNKKPLKLWELDLETDPRKFSKKVTSVRNAISSALVGNEDFSVSDLLSAEYDLKYAAKNFKFALVPKVASELAAVTTVEFIAHDETSYSQWTDAFHTVTSAYDSLASNPSVEQTMRLGVSDVETVVLAANSST